MDLTNRIDQLELMDSVTYPLSVMEKVLRFLEITNTYFGGTQVILRHLRNWSKNWKKNETIKILDIGTGGGEIPLALAKWARKEKISLAITAIDLVPEIIQIAQDNTKTFPEIKVLHKNLWDFEDDGSKFDYVIGSLLLHHIAIPEQIKFLQKLDRLASKGIVLSDLKRSHLSYWVVSLLSHLIGNQIVKNDGPLSVRRAFTIGELDHLAQSAGLPFLQSSSEPWFRVSLAGEKSFKRYIPSPRKGRGQERGPTPVPSPHGEGETHL